MLELAQQYLLIQKNIEPAIQALHLAQGQMSQEQEKQIKNAVAQMIQTLEEIKIPNQEQLIKQLAELTSAFNQLSNTPPQNENTSVTPKLTPLQSLKESFKKLIKKAIVVQQENTSYLNGMVPSQTYLTSQAQLWLLKAQWAIFQQQDRVFEYAIDQVLNLLKTQFVQNEKNQMLIQKLEQLKSISIIPKFPDLSPLIKKIKEQTPSIEKHTHIKNNSKLKTDESNQNEELREEVQEPRVLAS